MKVLTSIEARIVASLGETLFPKEGAITLDAIDTRVVAYVDDFMSRIPARDRWLVRGMFVLFELGIAAFGPARAPRFSTASPEARRAYLASWENAELYFRRVAFQALRSVFTMAYLADPEVRRQMGVEDGTATLRRHRAEEKARAEVREAAQAAAAAAAAAAGQGSEARVPAATVGAVVTELEPRARVAQRGGR
ncbi:MAG TPA: hypothetical protein VG389_22045 [Myxococcota bacterium]|nr:hypothetical protein [Myxococcota bacterium]